MVLDGERLKGLLQNAQHEVLLCTPFIKANVLETVLSVVEASVFVRIFTRWRAAEIAAGVSDLAVFEIANERLNTELKLLDDIHAKLYIADNRGLVGSANLTATALGWAERSNVEILIPVQRNQTEVSHLLKRLESATIATFKIRSGVEAEAAALVEPKLDESLDMIDEDGGERKQAWLPRCAAPKQLYAMYLDADTMDVVEATRADGLADLHDLSIPKSLAKENFGDEVQNILRLMPVFKRIIDLIPKGLSDTDGVRFVVETRPGLSSSEAALQWRIIRDWIEVFFANQFEVAPDSFVTRLRQR